MSNEELRQVVNKSMFLQICYFPLFLEIFLQEMIIFVSSNAGMYKNIQVNFKIVKSILAKSIPKISIKSATQQQWKLTFHFSFLSVIHKILDSETALM